MERTPLIGITVDHDDEQSFFKLNYSYAEAVVAAGGAAVLLAYAPGMDAAAQISAIDGLLMTGGNDIDPAAWGEARHEKARPADARRDRCTPLRPPAPAGAGCAPTGTRR